MANTPQEVAASIDFTGRKTAPTEITGSAPVDQANIQQNIATLNENASPEARANRDRGLLDSLKSAFMNEATAGLVQAKTFETDPNYTPEQFSKDLEAAKKNGLGPEYFSKLANSNSAADFQHRLMLAEAHQKNVRALAGDGYYGVGATLFATFADPASLGVALASGGIITTGAKLAKIASLSRTANGAADAIKWGLVPVAAKDAFTPQEVHPSEYAAAAALGFGFGYAFGPIAAKNPELVAPAQAVAGKLNKALDEEIVRLTPKEPEPIRLPTQADRDAAFPEKLPEPINDAERLNNLAPKAEDHVIPHADNDAAVLKAANDAAEPRAATGNDNVAGPIGVDREPTVAVPAKPATHPVDDAVAQLKAQVGNDHPVAQIADHIAPVVKEFIPGAANDTGRVLERANLSPVERMRLAEDASRYTAPHRNAVPEDLKKVFGISFPAHIERDILSLAGPAVQRIRAMGIDVRAFMSERLPGVRGFFRAQDGLVGLRGDLDPKTMAGIIEHEEIHALRAKSAFAPGEFEELVAASKELKVGSGKRTVFEDATKGEGSGSFQHYKRIGTSPERLAELADEEAVARLVGNERIIGLEGSKAEAIVKRIKDGTYAKQVADRDGVAPHTLYEREPGALDTDGVPFRDKPQPEEMQFLRDSGLADVKPEDVAKTFNAWGYAPRLDIAGWLGKSSNHVTRILGDLLLNDTVGKAGNGVNGQAIELIKTRLQGMYRHQINEANAKALPEWVKDTGRPNGFFQQADNNRAFQREIGKAIRGITPEGQVHPAVAQVAAAHRKVYAEMAEHLKNPGKLMGRDSAPIPGAENLDPNASYITRRAHQGELNAMINTHGFNNVADLVKKAIVSAQPNLDDALASRIARGYLTTIHRSANGIEEDLGMIIASGQRDALAGALRKIGLTDEEVGRAVEHFTPKPDPGGVMPRLKNKTLLDETAEHTFVSKDGTTQTIRFQDLLDHDADRLMDNYLTRTTGRIALANAVFRNPTTGEVVIDGFRTDAEFAKYMTHLQEAGASSFGKGYTSQTMKEEVEALQFGYDRILGRPLSNQQGKFAQTLRFIRSLFMFKLVNTGYFAQMSEAASIVRNMGLKAALQHMPSLGTMIRGGTSERAGRTLFREVQAVGVGIEGAHGMNVAHGFDSVRTDELAALGYSKTFQRATDAVQTFNKGVSMLSRMPHFTDAQQQWAASAMAQRIVDMGRKARVSRGDVARFNQLGLDQAMIRRVQDQIKTHGSLQPGLFGGSKLRHLNFENWTDTEAAAALQQGMFRASRKAIQSNDIGMMSQFMSNPMAQTIFQFKTFSINGYANHTLYALNHADAQTAIGLTTEAGLGAALYALQQQVNSFGRSDRDKFLQDKLSVQNLVAGGFQRMGTTSILPMIYDSVVPHATNTKPVFNTRSSGNSSSVALGAPLMGAFDNATTGIGGLVSSMYSGRTLSQPEIRALLQNVPLANWAAISPAINALIADRPTRPPKTVDVSKALGY